MADKAEKTVDIKKAVKMGLVEQQITMGELAKLTGRELSTLSGMLTRGKPSLSSVMELMGELNAKVVIRYENGNEVVLEGVG